VKLGHDLEASLRLIPGLKVNPSAANFVLLELTDPSFDADRIFVELGCRGILVRTCDSFFGMRKGSFLRVADRTAIENERLVGLLSEICSRLRDQADQGSPATNAFSDSHEGSISQPVSNYEVV
jgi:histidinol-phosphate/aromatic aminotransferase/cobyric acid decarboxylase-like protein